MSFAGSSSPSCLLASLGPFGWLVWAALTGNLSANPLSDLTNETGVWTLRFICITLAITPLRKLTGWNAAIRFRRMTGLFAFFYGTLHFLTYVDRRPVRGARFPRRDVAWSTARNLVASVGDDIYKRPFITVGFTAWMTMVPLALTSTAGMIRRLGGRRWNLLHRLVYLDGDARRAALLVARESRCPPPAHLRRRRRHPSRRADAWRAGGASPAPSPRATRLRLSRVPASAGP